MLKSEKFIREFRLIERDERDFCDPYLLDGFIARLEHEAIAKESPLGGDSYDSTEKYIFSDGSDLTVDNPRQAVFAAHVGTWIKDKYLFV